MCLAPRNSEFLAIVFVAEDDGGVGDGDDAELEASECAACETGRIRF